MSRHDIRTLLPVLCAALLAACIEPTDDELERLRAESEELAGPHELRQAGAPEQGQFEEELLEACGVCPHSTNQFAGGPGDAFTCWCSAEAAQDTGQWGRIWGTDIYTDDSQPCRAGVHAGAIGLEGGRIQVTIAPGQASYLATLRHGVQSLAWGEWPRSFSVAPGLPCCQDNSDCEESIAPGGAGKKAPDPVESSLYCRKPVGACDSLGYCAPRPDACTQEYDPVLGCDDQEYGNACEAAAAGVSVAVGGGV